MAAPKMSVLAFCGILLVTVVGGYTIRCPNGFVGYDKSCYKFVKMGTSWMEAKVLCETMDSHLVEIESPLEEQFIMQRVYFIQPDLQDSSLWIGASDLMNENEWVWMHSKKRLGYRNWNMNRAEALEQGHGRCLAMQTQPYFAWTEVGCDETLSFICEHEM